MHEHVEDDKDVKDVDPSTTEEWIAWLTESVAAQPSYATHAALLTSCCKIAATWYSMCVIVV